LKLLQKFLQIAPRGCHIRPPPRFSIAKEGVRRALPGAAGAGARCKAAINLLGNATGLLGAQINGTVRISQCVALAHTL